MELFLISLTTLFATVGPLDVAVIFAAITANDPPGERLRTAVKGTIIAGVILLIFALFGWPVLDLFGISLPALRISGGILLLLIAIDMVFARSSGAVSTTPKEEQEANVKQDVSVFPLATPLLAGPGTIGALILLTVDANQVPNGQAIVLLALALILGLSLLCMLIASYLHKLLGKTGVQVIARVFGVLLAALAVQYMLDGLRSINALELVAGL